MYGAAHRSGILGIVQEGTYERVVKPSGSTVKKVVRIEVEILENKWGCVARVGEFENQGQKSLGPREM